MSAPEFGLTPDREVTLRCLFSGKTTAGRMVDGSGKNLLVDTNEFFELAAPVQISQTVGSFILGDVDSCVAMDNQYRIRVNVKHRVSGD